MQYSVEFKWQGDIATEQDRMIEWLEAHGYECVCSYGTDGTGHVFLRNLEDTVAVQRDLGIVVTEAKLVDTDALIGVETEATPV